MEQQIENKQSEFYLETVPLLSLGKDACSLWYLDTLFDFDRSSRIDNTIQKLREQVPLLLVRPLDRSSASKLYAESVILLGPSNEELASNLDKLVTLSTTLVTASSATRQASCLARSLAATSVVELKHDLG